MDANKNLNRDVDLWLVTLDLFVLLVCVLISRAWISTTTGSSSPSICLGESDRWVDWVHKLIFVIESLV